METNQKKIPVKRVKLTPVVQLLIVLTSSVVVFVVSSRYDILERFVEFSIQHEQWNVDEILILTAYLSIALLFFSMLRWRDAITSGEELRHRNQELEATLHEVRHLRGILPICASCKKIRDDKGYWHQVELYIRDHSEAEFSHGICPECMAKLYPNLTRNDVNGSKETTS